MGKQDLINQVSKDRTRWPVEARVCEKIWILTKKFGNNNLIQNYIDKKLSFEDIDFLLNDKDNTNIIQDIIDLKHECLTMLPKDETLDKQNNVSNYIEIFCELGTVLATDNIDKKENDSWWSRYITITNLMGVECVLSIRTAESLFKRDPNAGKIKTILYKLTKEDI